MTATPEQAGAALAKANQRRREMSALKQELSAMEPDVARRWVAAGLRTPSPVILAMKVEPLLDSITKLGARTYGPALAGMGIRGTAKVRHLTKRQREVLAEWVLHRVVTGNGLVTAQQLRTAIEQHRRAVHQSRGAARPIDERLWAVLDQ